MLKNASGDGGSGMRYNRSFSTLGCSFYFLGGIFNNFKLNLIGNS
jgi:hypothetical protein